MILPFCLPSTDAYLKAENDTLRGGKFILKTNYCVWNEHFLFAYHLLLYNYIYFRAHFVMISNTGLL
jgi:hypothetical protein